MKSGFAAFLLILSQVPAVSAEPTLQAVTIEELRSKLEIQAAELVELRARLDQRESIYEPVASELGGGCQSEKRRLPVVVEDTVEPSCAGSSTSFHTLRYFADYENGFVIRPFDADKHPFQVKINGWIQFRHHAFIRDVDSWTDNAGVTRPVRNRNAFDIERGRLIISGHAISPRITYLLQIDGDTDGFHGVDFFDYWFAWQCTDRFKLQFGKRKVPADRQWLLGVRRTRLVDRPMVDDFMRPDRSVGVFGIGDVGRTGHYEFMIGNGYRTTNLPNELTDDRLAFAATNYFDPWGDFGNGFVDYEWTEEPLMRLGHSFIYAPHTSDVRGIPLDESDFVRLTDGTRLTELGALTPGVTVTDFDIYFYSADIAFRWQGWSMNAEFYLRWIEQISGDGHLDITDLLQRGFYVEGGKFLVARKLDFNVRYSQVSGLFNNASEYAAGFNWYPLETQKVRITFDVTSLNRSPLQNTASDIWVGDDGTLLRTQFQAEY